MRVELVHRLQHVAARPGGDVEQAHRPARGVRLLDRRRAAAVPGGLAAARMPRQPMLFEIAAVDQPAERRDALRPVLVDVIERHAGIEAVLPAEVDAAAQPARPSSSASARAANRRPPGPRSRSYSCLRVAAPVGVEQRRVAPAAARSAPSMKSRTLATTDVPVLLVEDRVVEAGQHLEALDRRRELARRTRRWADAFTTQSEPAASTSVGTVMAPASASSRVEVSCRSSSMLTAICAEDQRVGVVALGLLGGRA